ncbi:putative pre-mrna-splicing factor protein [Lasiodiplodia theobromae]|uniref:Pre-mrna-splicing factor protein n=1 Tax=Lasiodiplodia theobromae TaxID=45133 RepID=A0A8H7MAP6_9PEZI|nr:Transcriptional repressor [Lasiodiplodia theobromae]KAF4541770.1 Transcriptional repressor [Lasiodiplodia theobromae]KAF9629783.1 putative pre-mrna-splicing factor protein [Lasiodiplodia theobromae]
MASNTKGRVPTGFADEIVISEASFRSAHRAREAATEPPSKKRKREEKGDSSIVYGKGAYKGPWAKYQFERPDAASDEEGSDVEIVYEEDEIEEQPAAPTTKDGTAYEHEDAAEEKTVFHGSQEFDYQGRTYMHVPQDLGISLRGEITDLKNYIPKKCIHTWKHHTKAINALRFFPDSGHLLLSASADNTVKIWDVYHNRELLRSYMGHNKSVNDICFNNDGTQFLSASYDRQMKLWDTETGKCITKFSTGKTPHVVRFNPDPALNHEFLAGMADKKIVQFDTRTQQMVQEYDHHLGPVNTITFCDENRRFITTSDDKSLRAWEYGIPVPIKFIAEPYMYPMVRSAPHPSGKYVAFQSSDNQIVVYACTDRFRQNRKKSFRGHNNAGYAIDVSISPDGQFVSSGDSGGFVTFWDWKTCKMYHKIQASDAPVISTNWHPRETSKVVTGDLNGVIKFWD